MFSGAWLRPCQSNSCVNKMSRHFTLASCFLLLIALPGLLAAQEVKPTYTLFHPVPRAGMREMETDRPDVTESPYTVDAGHIQYETDLFRLERFTTHESQENTYLFNQGNLKIGLTKSTAIQIGFQSFVWQVDKELPAGGKTGTHGIGDLTFRIKQNLMGNDGGNFILAVLPYIKLPTAKYTEDSKYEGGLIVPMQFKLPGEWKMGVQVEGDRLKNDDNQSMHTELLQSVTISHELFKKLEGIAETYYTYNFNQHHWGNFVNASLQLDIAHDIKLDAGCNYGLQHDAEKNYFVGTSFRF
jgi:hypothetical protein